MSCKDRHPPAPIWTTNKHFGFCSSLCPCCRAYAGFEYSSCSVCIQDIKDKYKDIDYNKIENNKIKNNKIKNNKIKNNNIKINNI